MKNLRTKAAVSLTVMLFLIFSGCKTNPPVSPPEPEYGKIFVISNIDSASIFVDNANTGKVTPDTVEALEGARTVKIVKDGYITNSVQVQVFKDQTSEVEILMQPSATNKMVLLEDFANVSCVPCVTTNKITHSLSQSYAGKLHIVKFPTNFPKPTDPFYLAAKAECDARMSYYNIITAPTVIINGITRPVSSDSNDIKRAIDSALTEESIFDITVNNSVSGGIIYTNISVSPVNTTGINLSEYTLHTAVIEKIIEFATPPGSNGETVFYDVLRRMLPSSSGTALQENNLTSTVEYSNQTEIGAAWNINELATIVYIQNKNTRKVIQVASAEPTKQ
jgi:hypothetical protein